MFLRQHAHLARRLGGAHARWGSPTSGSAPQFCSKAAAAAGPDEQPADPARLSADAAAASSSATRQGDAAGEQPPPFVYEGPFAATVSRLKKLSLFSCACTSAGAPLLVMMDSAAASSMGGKVAVVATLSGFGFMTTGLLAWFTGPYVHRLTYEPASQRCEAVTLSLLGRRQTTRFSPDEAEYPQGLSPLSTFQVDNKVLYVDATHFKDKQLLERLSPKPPGVEGDEGAGGQQGGGGHQQQGGGGGQHA